VKPLAIDLFCGLFGWSSGLVAEGWETIGVDLEDMCGQFGVGRPPHTHLLIQDVLTLHGSQLKDAALIVASPPCFVADTLILTARGLIPVQDVVPDDLALTHRNRWRRVLRTGSSMATTVIASGHGAMIEGTHEHPIYVRHDEGSRHYWSGTQSGPVYIAKSLGQPTWIPLAEAVGCHWASPTAFGELSVPALPNGIANTPAFWWMVGRWVGDGWLRRRPKCGSSDEVLICCAHGEADDLEVRLANVAPRRGRRAAHGELHWNRSRERTATRFTACSNALAAWLATHFGCGASAKAWPAWALGMDETARRALLDGYVSADGYLGRNAGSPVVKASTVSKRLAIGTRFLAASLGCTSAVYHHPRPSHCKIEGRVVRQRDAWETHWTPDSERNRLVERSDGMQWGKVRQVEIGQENARVWNLEVEEDNSYVADGVVVHNCQEFSWMAMPWSRAKQVARALRGEGEFPANYRGSRTQEQLTELFNACFRIQREACEVAGRHIPLIVENVRGAQPWVGQARWSFGSFYLWGDVPALMPMTARAQKFNPDGTDHGQGSWFAVADSKERGARATKNNGGSWFNVAYNTTSGKGQNPDGRKVGGDWFGPGENCSPMRRCSSRESGTKQPGISGPRANGKGDAWFQDGAARSGSKSNARKAASAMIAKIPAPLARHIARTFKP
jgi:hypothetical protein